MMFDAPEMETPFPAFTVSFRVPFPLAEKPGQGHTAGRENSEVPVKGHDPFIFLQGKGGTHGNRFLPDPAEPFADLSLPEQDQHFFLDHSG
jgi:hypothetical protein